MSALRAGTRHGIGPVEGHPVPRSLPVIFSLPVIPGCGLAGGKTPHA